MIELITQRVIELLPTPQAGQKFLWDSDLKGFGVRVGTSGVKSYVVQYRSPDGRLRRMAFARCNLFDVEDARQHARTLLAKATLGIDPADEKNEARRNGSVAEVCDWYLTEAESQRLVGRRRRPIKASTLRMDRSRIERHIKPLLGTRYVKSLRLADIENMQADIAAGKSRAGMRGGRGRVTTGGSGAASRVVSTLHSVFEHAVRMGVIENNPARGVRRLQSNRRTRRLSAGELVRLGEAMRWAAEHDEHPVGLAAVRLIALTGFRLMEAQALERAWVDRQQGCVCFPDTKSDAQNRAIGPAAHAVIAAQTPVADNPYLFPSDDGRSHYKQVPDVIARLCHRARIEGVSAHTLRHTFGSVAGDLGFSEFTIAMMLGHGKRNVTQGYIHIDEALWHAIETTSAKIADLLDGKTDRIRAPRLGGLDIVEDNRCGAAA